MSEPLLRVEGLTVEFPTPDGWLRVIEDVTFDVAPSEVVGIVGESGSGKTVTAMAIMGLLAHQRGVIRSGSVVFDGIDLVDCSERRLRELRGRSIGMVFQQALRSLNPGIRVGEQIAETARRHLGIGRREAWDRAVTMLERVGIADARRRARSYPHELSGGMCQRVMIAIALVCGPKLLIADEPTTALDVRVQRKVLELIREIHDGSEIAVLFVSHDLGVMAELCDRIIVMYAGEVVERGTLESTFVDPRHPYTSGLLSSIPRGPSDRLIAIEGSVPEPGRWPTGCRFSPRCPHVAPECAVHPDVRDHAGGECRCHRAGAVQLRGVLEAR